MLAIDSTWWVFAHVAGVLGFVMTHGVSVFVLLALKRERDRGRIGQLMALSQASLVPFYVSTVLLLVGGIGAGVARHWFWRPWLTISLAVFVALTMAMGGIARPYTTGIREGLASDVSDEELAGRIGGWQPTAIYWSGAIGSLIILWLMIFKKPL